MKYRVVVADPPWSYEDKLRMGGTVGVKRSADSHYTVLGLDDIKALPVADLCHTNAVLALWVPNTLVASHGHPTMERWGFTYKQRFDWVKTSKGSSGLAFGMGRMFRNCSESALIGVRGRPKCLNNSQRNVLLSPATPHSQKPEALQDSLELMFEGPYLELFARRDRPGWDCTGNECGSTLGVDIGDWFNEAQ